MSIFAGVRMWELVLVVTIMCVLAGFEIAGLVNPHFVTITRVLKAAIPMPVRFMVLAWLGYHFIITDLVRMVQAK